jgi:zinc D-Ala-D-Ala carboxypeptidase
MTGFTISTGSDGAFVQANDFRELESGQWRWENFEPAEFACRGEPGRGSLFIGRALLDRLQALRRAVGRPMVVTSGYRSPGYNASLPGAAANSTHARGLAADISMGNFFGDEKRFYQAALDAGFTGFGFYPEYRNIFMHLDIGPPRWWGNPTPWGISPRP